MHSDKASFECNVALLSILSFWHNTLTYLSLFIDFPKYTEVNRFICLQSSTPFIPQVYSLISATQDWAKMLGSLQIGLEGQKAILKWIILSFACFAAFFSRLFAVIRYESVIHEFDPYFNYR